MVGKMILNSIACNREIIHKRKSQKDVLNLTVVLRNCHSNPNHQELPPWSVGSHQFWGKTQDDDLLKAQGIARIFFFQLLNHGLPFATPLTTACQATLSSTISSSLLRFMSIELVMLSNYHAWLPSSLPAPRLSQHHGFFPVSWLFTSSGQSIVVSASASVLPLNIQCWFHLGLTGLISLLSKGLSRVFFSTTFDKNQFFST